MSKLGVILRWLIVPIAVVAVPLLAVAAGRWAVSLADQRCPADSMVGGACVEPWHTGFVELTIYAGAAVAALGLALLPALIAPAGRRLVALLAVLLPLAGIVLLYVLAPFTNFIFPWPDIVPPLGLAALCGAAGIALVWLRSPRNHA